MKKPLSNKRIKEEMRGPKARRLFDERGLYLELAPLREGESENESKKRGKWWRFKYRFGGVEKRISLGTYPDVSLKGAREKRDEARALLGKSIDPGANRKAAKAAGKNRDANSFEVVAREWYDRFAPSWAESHSGRLMRLFERDVFPWIGAAAIDKIEAPALLDVLRRIEKRGAVETAHRARTKCGQVFRYGIATGRCKRDPSADLRGALPPVKEEHFAATTDLKRLGEILRAMDSYRGTLPVRCALRLAPLVFVRPGELRKAMWRDFNFETAEWRYLVSKTGVQHIVPLSRQAVAILEELRPLTGDGDLVFPSARGKGRPMSDAAVLAAMRYLGIGPDEMTTHGLRAVARTLLDEELGFAAHLIEHQLSHRVKDALGRSYNRTTHLPERKRMMQEWSDYLEQLKTPV